MMRKLSVVLTVVALLAVMATSAFAAPNLSGLVRYEPHFSFDDEFEAKDGGLLVQVNASGDVSDTVSYYFRLQGSGTTSVNIARPLAYIDVKELVGEGSRVRLGLQGAGTGQGFVNSGTRHGLSINVPVGDLKLYAFADQTLTDVYAGRAGYVLPIGEVGVNLRSELDNDDERLIGYSADVDFSFDGLGNVYGEFGKSAGADEFDIVFVGISLDVIKDATGWGNYFDFTYDVDGDDHAWEVGVSKKLDNGITTTLILDNDLLFKTRFQVSF